MRYGYKVATAYLTPPNRPGERIAFDDPDLGADGARGLLHDALQALMGGADDEQRSLYSRLDGVHMDGWGVLLSASGGSYGEAAEVVDRRTGRARRALAHDDAVLRDARLLWLMPPHGTVGLLLSEARGRSHLGPAVVRRLNYHLKLTGAVMRLDSDVADDVAWSGFLDHADVSVSGIELVQNRRSLNGGRLTEEDVVSKALLTLSLEPGTQTQRRVRDAVGALRGRQRQRLNLAGLVGLRRYGDDDFDEEHLVVVQDGRKRRVNVTSGWPSFVYDLGEDRVSDAEFLDEVRQAAEDTMEALEVDHPQDWWPRLRE